MIIVFVVIMIAAFHLEKMEWREAAVWTVVAAGVGWILFRRQDMLAMNLGVGTVAILLALRVFGGAAVPRR